MRQAVFCLCHPRNICFIFYNELAGRQIALTDPLRTPRVTATGGCKFRASSVAKPPLVYLVCLSLKHAVCLMEAALPATRGGRFACVVPGSISLVLLISYSVTPRI